ncbi:hypothetical protein VSW15_002291 [Enterococcus faecium]|uniref:hypothetical protein n=1 Tax=Enterococcus faecium TaxID=1352 RepID=UPI0002A3E18A|nr:hypothetical protein [Enterococcus faecium]EGP5736468.1 hypothetical protein [Enterococcus faecium]ELB05723.1 hypothetical protein OIG_04187 [Enterococcus faecium EnGen0028]EME3190074.1 hypothetical protein [Enterococcus faecium]EOF69684.1 hypothetical protein SEU_01333 [Enterococcus faecium EnGen0130]
MAQEINEVGTIDVTMKKNVIFTKRKIKNIFISEDDICTIGFMKSSVEGDILETIVIPFSLFHEIAEDTLWKLIDSTKESGE